MQPQLTSLISTVTGLVKPGRHAFIDAHDHLVAHPPADVVAADADLRLDEPERVEADLRAVRQSGPSCIVEMTTIDYGRDVDALRDLSLKTGVDIVAATGFNKGRYCRAFCEGREPDDLARSQIADVIEGAGLSQVRCGVVKFGTGFNEIEPWEEVAGRAAARTHLSTGCPIFTHTEAGTMAEEQLALLEQEGVPAGAVTLGHLDRNPDLELHTRLASAGAFISYDQIPKTKYATEAVALELIVALARRQLHQQVVIGGDFARRTLFVGYSGSPGLAYLPTMFARRLRDAADAVGLDGGAIVEDVLSRNPQRALAFRRLPFTPRP